MEGHSPWHTCRGSGGPRMGKHPKAPAIGAVAQGISPLLVPATLQNKVPGRELQEQVQPTGWMDHIPSSSTKQLLLPTENQVRAKQPRFAAGVSLPPGEGLGRSLQTEHERQVGAKPHSLSGPTVAKFTDKLTYKGVSSS